MAILSTERNSGKAGGLLGFTQGIDVDRRLALQEIRVQKAWAGALVQAGILNSEEATRISVCLDEASQAVIGGTFDWRIEDEDVHMNLERFVTERLGLLGKRMHLGRSRNDLIATSLRLFVRDSLREAGSGARELVSALCARAEGWVDVLVPGLTHLQNGQPVRLAHVLCGHGWAVVRDLERLGSAAERATARMPLGSAALAGTTLNVDLQGIARELGFAGPPDNSYDAVGDRDFVVEGLGALSLLAVHLSRLCEDLIFWSSSAVGLIRLPKAWSTGSSIMPNKRNPDVPELCRAKSAHVIGAQADAHALLKGVATSYGSDLHEIKQVYLRGLDEVMACLGVLPSFVREMECDRAVAATLLGKGHILATEIADHLAARGVPFRESYGQVAALVERAEKIGVQVQELEREVFRELAPATDPGFVAELTYESAVERRSGAGGTARSRVFEGIAALRGVSASEELR